MKTMFLPLVLTALLPSSPAFADLIKLEEGEHVSLGATKVTCGNQQAGKGKCNAYGCASCGTCTAYGCPKCETGLTGGSCNAFGCWEGANGECNMYGCSDNGKCNAYGCSDHGECNAYGCP